MQNHPESESLMMVRFWSHSIRWKDGLKKFWPP